METSIVSGDWRRDVARIRTIKPEFFTDEEVAAMSPLARIAYQGLWCQADREGRLKDRPVRLKALILPYDKVDMVEILDEIERNRFIRRYTVDGLALIHVRTLVKHQQIPTREPDSVLPPPADGEKHVPSTASTMPEHGGREGKGKEGNGKGKDGSAAPQSSATPEHAVGTVMTFDTVGGNPTWALTEALLAKWQSEYSTLDIARECRRARTWLEANPRRRKTSRGMPAFLVNWFNRATDSGRGHQYPADSLAGEKPDARGHFPPCRTNTECNRKLEQEIAARKAAAS